MQSWTKADVTDAAVIDVFKTIPTLLTQNAALVERGRRLDVECLLGPIGHPFHVSIKAGKIVDMTPAPVLMRSWRFGYRASAAGWTAFWQPMPKAGWHDLLSLTKRGEAILDGELQPFMTHLQYFKDLLALPRQTGTAS
jgi:uncharacterized protein (DUF2235 family)